MAGTAVFAVCAYLASSQELFLASSASNRGEGGHLFEHDPSHNGGIREELVEPHGPQRPHVLFVLVDDWGWAHAGWRGGGPHTPTMDALVKEGVDLARHYVYQFCSPTRAAVQTGRNPLQVNPLNLSPNVANPEDPVAGFAGAPRNLTGLATKLAAAGYRTHFSGKWDLGMATPDHTPRGRGYHTSLSYFHHSNSYWDQHFMDESDGCLAVDPLPTGDPVDPPGSVGIVVDLWLAGADGSEGPAHGLNSTCGPAYPFNMGDLQKYDRGTSDDYGPWPGYYRGFVAGESCRAGPAAGPLAEGHGGYEDALFEEDVLAAIETHHDVEGREQPLFVFWAPHIAHAPLQVPAAYLDRFADIGDTDNRNHARQIYTAMVQWLDDALANVTGALRRRGMWDNTLLIVASDNGGAIYQNGTSGSNNHPLRGGKMSNWEGGIRVNAFAAGGFIPSEMRGRRYDGLMAGWDWYATLCDLAGVSSHDRRAELAGLPPVDSYSFARVLDGSNLTSPRRELALGAPTETGGEVGGVLELPWKFLVGSVPMAGWTGPAFPNETTDTYCFDSAAANPSKLPVPCAPECLCIADCGEEGCLFNVEEDPTEHRDLSAAEPAVAARLRARVQQLQASPPTAGGPFNPDRGSRQPAACARAMANGGFWGPWLP